MKSIAEMSHLLIDRGRDMRPLLDDLAAIKAVAVDTESNSLYAYYEQVCLIQFSTPSTDYLVDPLALSSEDIQQLRPIFADAGVQKVFHAAEYDLIVLSRDFGFTFENLFDTMWAACIVGKEEVGLAALLQSEFNLNLDKRYQKADWGQRPLPENLREYAVQDTHYLLALREKMEIELNRSGRKELAVEDFARFCKINGHDKTEATYAENIAASVFQEAGRHHLSRLQTAVLEELYLFRDEVARARNQPPFKILPERMLLALAKAGLQESATLNSIEGINHRLVRRYGDGLMKSIQRGIKKGTPSLKPVKHAAWRDDAYQNRLGALKDWRKNTAAKMGVKSDVVLARAVMENIAHQNPPDLDGLRVILKDSPWRQANFGGAIMTVLQKLK
jgi:ribonuclease D